MDRSATSPTSPRRTKNPIIPGFRASPRQNQRPVSEMTVRELQDRHRLNTKLLSSPGASTSTYVQRVQAEQAAVESRLIELDGMEAINTGLKRAAIRGEGDMQVDPPSEPPTSRTLEAKRKALSQYGINNRDSGIAGSMSMQEALDLERQAVQQDKERQTRMEERKKRLGLPIKGEYLTRQEREARIWAFMNYKPTESDLEDEDDDDDDDDDDDPESWFEDDIDDGREGRDSAEPEDEDYSQVIRVDDSRLRYTNNFYDSRDGD